MALVNPKTISIFENSIEIRVRYQETDGQRRLHHANYLNYFEMGRVELLRANGISYKDLEDSGVILVVTDLQIKYLRPGDYDDVLTLFTSITRSKGARIEHQYELKKSNEILASGNSTIASIDNSGKPIRLPNWLQRTV
ncbi:MAG: thioesterase family protein [Pirellulaceae bacterium]|jgi:acyl-CoA thioester hydrolase|nr:thioesterase family protein [Pirellulaceae bacterium]